jgi:hypothetical protein
MLMKSERTSKLMAKRAVAEKSQKPRKTAPAATERVAREDMETLRGRPFSNQEWDRHSKRLIEFVKLLCRWDAEQRASAKCAKMESKNDQERVA